MSQLDLKKSRDGDESDSEDAVEALEAEKQQRGADMRIYDRSFDLDNESDNEDSYCTGDETDEMGD